MKKEKIEPMLMNLQFFAEGDSGDAGFDTGNEDLNALLGQIQTTETTPPEGDPPTEGEQTPPEATPPANEDVSQLSQNKQNFAFQQMRQQNQQLNQLLGKLAQANGIEYSNPKELIEKLNNNAIEAIAKTQNVPVSLLKEVEDLRRDSEAFKAMQFQNNAAAGFQAVVTNYGLDQKALEAFAIELDQAGVNPFTSHVDVLQEYKSRHFDEIMQAKIDEAVAAALTKNTSADTHSTTPSSTSTPTKTGGDEDKITTVEGLNQLLTTLNV